VCRQNQFTFGLQDAASLREVTAKIPDMLENLKAGHNICDIICNRNRSIFPDMQLRPSVKVGAFVMRSALFEQCAIGLCTAAKIYHPIIWFNRNVCDAFDR
jgi:hypothetical protein